MNLEWLNPTVRGAGIWERIPRSEECIAYDARLIYIISGDVSATVGGEKLGHLSPGHLLYIPAGAPYKLKGKYLRAAVICFDLSDRWQDQSQRIKPSAVADFKPECVHLEQDSAPFDKFLHLSDMEGDRDSFIHMCNLFTSAEGSYRARVSAMLKLILLKVAETADDNALPARMVDSLDEYIRTNCQDEISNTEIGAIFGYHPFYVSRVLKETKGQTLRQYIISYRLKAAKRLLEFTQKSINEIAEECGFKDASYFTKTFRSAFGMTPKDYRAGFAEDFI